MPELPDITIYVEALERFIVGEQLEQIRVRSPFLVRTVEPPIEQFAGLKVTQLQRIGKRIAIGFENDTWIVLHLMIAGRLRWKKPGTAVTGKNVLAAFDFPKGCLHFTEAASKKRASLHTVANSAGLAEFDPGGLDVLSATLEQFHERLLERNHTLKRALTDPRLFDGIGNAYSDEILHRARLSPIVWTTRLSDAEIEQLYEAIRDTMTEWIARHRDQLGERFPDKVTAFHPDMAVHGKFREPCPVCAAPIQRIRYADNETNYCPGCQTEGKILADRSLSRLLKDDWPRRLEDLEER
ncbi:Fpg/Nei family DNA glycosylase [Calycomorphotria hydatis]|uniref:Putative formamidopyrimidine-DNA glycosylase-like protein n=1 Tax=Calycomorphotria hydatis TaxID=2528027 RepID=A0A517T7H4_9PLAN|nr:DNA-formamidopyrimidine glycosylase family protein [Calycomorphotria hydatis]QDT64300.1 putative formamidopyrimidine-DNA glycosylase-like protein [Calycomorphotria hydatis]